MKLGRLLLAVPLALFATLDARDADACGGCFVPPEESTQVTGHRMVLSISNSETTLWDQIEYSGNPAEFAWVLPTKGIVDIGLSSDVMFAYLGDGTRVSVVPPPLNCPPPPDCWLEQSGDGATGSGDFDGEGASGGANGGVEVIAQEVVGPYETVQLSSDDPAALKTWLTDHGYSLPDDIAPIVDAYVAEGFNFLALKLVPGEGVDSMRPVRVTTPGGGIGLPLRMVAAGTGAVTAITLWVLGEGRHEPSNFPSFTIAPEEVVWDWAASDSNYATLKAAGFESSNGAGWLVETAREFSPTDFQNNIMNAVDFGQSGYGDETGMGAFEEAQADLDKLFAALEPSQVWVSRLHAELPRAQLGKDLEINGTQGPKVDGFIQCEKSVGTPPPCPTYDCGNDGETEGFFDERFGPVDGGGSASDGCAVGDQSSGASWFVGVGLALALAAARRRLSRGSASRWAR